MVGNGTRRVGKFNGMGEVFWEGDLEMSHWICWFEKAVM